MHLDRDLFTNICIMIVKVVSGLHMNFLEEFFLDVYLHIEIQVYYNTIHSYGVQLQFGQDQTMPRIWTQN